MLLEKLVEIHFTQSCSCSFYHQKAKLRNLKWSHHYQLGKLRGRTHIDWDTQNVCDPENELNNNFHKEFLNRKGTRGHAEHQRHRWEGEMGEMASPPLFPVVTQLLTAPPVCITRSEQGKSCSGGNLMQPPQCLAGWDCLGMSPQGDGKCYPMAHGVSLSPPNSSAGADAEGISRKHLEVINFCQKSERREKKNGKKWDGSSKDFWVPANFGEFSKAFTGSHAGVSHDSRAARAQAGKAEFGNGDHL